MYWPLARTRKLCHNLAETCAVTPVVIEPLSLHSTVLWDESYKRHYAWIRMFVAQALAQGWTGSLEEALCMLSISVNPAVNADSRPPLYLRAVLFKQNMGWT